MRQIGSFQAEELAARFIDYLLTLEIPAQHDADDGDWIVWVRDENDVERAKEELRIFESNPDSPVYVDATSTAKVLRDEEIKRRYQIKKNVVEIRGSWSAPMSRRAPLLMALMAGCVVAAVLGGGLNEKSTPVEQWLKFDEPATASFKRGDGFGAIRKGQIWRLVTPILLHGGLPHLVFNLYWMYILGGQIESKIGTVKFAGIVLAAAVVPNVLQNVLSGPNFVGISGVVFALFGYMWIRRKDGYLLSDSTIMIVMIIFVLGFTPFLGGIAAWAHAGGLAVGVAIGYLPKLVGPRRRS